MTEEQRQRKTGEKGRGKEDRLKGQRRPVRPGDMNRQLIMKLIGTNVEEL